MNHEKKRAFIITDCKDVAFTEIKSIILNECLKMGFDNVDVELVAVSEFSIVNAAFLARLIADYCSAQTVISLVINPQKHRSARIFGRLANGAMYFGANTGALSWLLADLAIDKVYEIIDPGFMSFGGKFVHAPHIAKLLAEVPFENIGKAFPIEMLAKCEIPTGTIVHIDNFGLIKIMGEPLTLKDGEKVNIYKNGEYILDAMFAERMMSHEDKEWILYTGSSLNGLPELGSVRYKNGFRDIGANIGDVISWNVT